MRYLVRVGVSFSSLFNVLLGGPVHQTFSARNYGWKREGKPNAVCIIDLVFGSEHCVISWTHWYLRHGKENK